jgi:coenzyme F420 hydrogenase subunit beta
MTFLRLKSEILDRNLCASCGGCVAVCPPGALRLDEESQPRLMAALSTVESVCGGCTLCVDVCPGRDTGCAETEMRMFGRTRSREERWSGIVRGIYSVTCLDQTVRSRAAAGGGATGVLLAGLRSGIADAVLIVGRDRERPWIPRAVLTDDEATVIGGAQSSYCITPNLQLLRDPPWKRIGLVGLPCEIQALGKMRNLGPGSVADRVVFTLELACSSNTRLAGTEHLITDQLGLALDDVVDLRYREGTYPGQVAVTTRDGQRRQLPFYRLVDEFKRFKTHRCLSCPDWWSGVADVSVCDGDPNIFKSSRQGESPPASSIVVARTPTAEALIRAGVELGIFAAEPGVLEIEHNLGLQRKRHRYARMQDSGLPVPLPAVAGADEERPLSDDDIIERLSAAQPAPASSSAEPRP